MATPPLALRPAKRRPTPHQQATPCALFDRAPVIRATRPDTAHVRAPRFLDLAGELLTATLIIAGGVFAYGFIPTV